MCLFRSNGFYAYLFCLPFFLIGFKKIRKQFCLVAIATLGVVLLFKGPVMSSFSVSEPDIVESLSIPLQQIARTLHEQGAPCLTSDESLYLSSIADLDGISDAYYCHISDNVKNFIRINGDQNVISQDLVQLH